MSKSPKQSDQVEQELRESLADIEHTLQAFSNAEEKLNAQQHRLRELRAPYDAERARLAKQIKNTVKATQASPHTSTSKNENATNMSESLPQAFEAAGQDQKTKPVTAKQVADLKKQISQPRPLAAPRPPQGIVEAAEAAIARDKKLTSKIKQKEQVLHQASEQFQSAWEKLKQGKSPQQSTGRKP